MTMSRRRLVLAPLALGLASRAGAAWSAPAVACCSPADRALAARRGLEAIYRSSQAAEAFAQHGHDYLWCFHSIAATSADPRLAQTARRMGEDRARAWRRLHPGVPADADADQVFALAAGSHYADRLGLPDTRLSDDLARAAARFDAADFLSFDPIREPPPDDVPDSCGRCGHDNARGRRRCAYCGAPLAMQSRYDLFSTALIVTYVGESSGLRLGAAFAEVAGRLPAMRPYPDHQRGSGEFEAVAYAVTHVVYTLNDYSAWRLQPEWLPQEFAFLRHNLAAAIPRSDGELLGEFMDSLKGFGVTDDDPLIGRASAYLLRTQHGDGSWGERASYHPTWTAVDGLRDYAPRGEGVSFADAFARARG